MVKETKQQVSTKEDLESELSSFFEDEPEDQEEKVKEFSIILKSSSEGSLEALKNSLEKLKVEGANIKIVDSGVGNITIRDIERAEITKAVILGFEVDTEKGVEDLAKKKKVLIKTYDVIYKLLEEMSDALNMLVIPEETEEEIGKGVVKAIFTLSDGTKVLGNRVEEGKLKRGCKVYVVRDDEILVESKIKSLRINKNDVNEATKGVDCGITLDTEVEAQEGDEIYCYKVVK
jgi:translation initiation factor IF-2